MLMAQFQTLDASDAWKNATLIEKMAKNRPKIACFGHQLADSSKMAGQTK